MPTSSTSPVPGGDPSMARRTAAVIIGLGLLATLPACSSNPPDPAFTKFLAGWKSGNLAAVQLVGTDGQPLAADAAKSRLAGWEGDLAGAPVDFKLAGKP